MALKEPHDSFRIALEGRLDKRYSSVRNEQRKITIYSFSDQSPYINLHDPNRVLDKEFFLIEIFAEKRDKVGSSDVASLTVIVDETLRRLNLVPRQPTKPNKFYNYYYVFEK